LCCFDFDTDFDFDPDEWINLALEPGPTGGLAFLSEVCGSSPANREFYRLSGFGGKSVGAR
jgi:hypothetical protein